MSCEEVENKIAGYHEGGLSAAERTEVENHLAECPGCRTFARQLQELDAALAAGIKAPALPAGFEMRLRERIQAGPATLSAAQQAERKRQLQAEFETGMAQIGRASFTLGSLLRHLTWPAVAGTLGWLACRMMPADVAENSIPWLVASAVFVVVGLAEAFPQQWKLPAIW